MHRRSTEQDDYLLRMIRQAGEALRRLRERLTGQAEAPAAIREEAVAAVEALLGDRASILQVLDAETPIRLAGDPGRISCWVQLLELEADAAVNEPANESL